MVAVLVLVKIWWKPGAFTKELDPLGGHLLVGRRKNFPGKRGKAGSKGLVPVPLYFSQFGNKEGGFKLTRLGKDYLFFPRWVKPISKLGVGLHGPRLVLG